ncbi:MAG: hypothetical protein NVS2B9_18120 [Myxococcales bacterium]
MKKEPPLRDEPPPNNPFGALAGLRPGLPAAPADGAPPGVGSPTAAPPPRGPARAVVWMERKGRGGKEVTAVEQLGLRPAELESWLKALKNALGCGGAVEKDTLLLQGDQRDRLKALLEARGVRRVILG